MPTPFPAVILRSTFRCALQKLQGKVFKMTHSNTQKNRFCLLSKAIEHTDSDDAVSDVLMPPSTVREMKVLNQEQFKKIISVPFVSVPVERTNAVVKALKKYFFKTPKIQPVSDSSEGKVILLNPDLINNDEFKRLTDSLEVKLRQKDVMLTYENYTKSAVIKAILPENLQLNVSSYSIVGHIIHLNIKEQISDYKTILAQVLLDKIANAKTIVNKAKFIDNTFRNFEMELLAGEPNYEVSTKENGCKYEFDFSKVFWNPRLSNEHQAMTKKFKSGDVVFDVFAGVGPFAIPAAKKGCEVYANDLNPDSFKWLCHNASINNVSDQLHCYNMDGSDFITSIVKDKLVELFAENSERAIHVLMNLPASALQFVSWFKSLIPSDIYEDNIKLPMVYCYFFDKKDDFEEKLIYKYLHEDVRDCINETLLIRNVAPNKTMVRLVFHIPRTYLFQKQRVEEKIESAAKKRKLSHGGSNLVE